MTLISLNKDNSPYISDIAKPKNCDCTACAACVACVVFVPFTAVSLVPALAITANNSNK